MLFGTLSEDRDVLGESRERPLFLRGRNIIVSGSLVVSSILSVFGNCGCCDGMVRSVSCRVVD